MDADVRVDSLLDEVRVMVGIARQDYAHIVPSPAVSAVDAREAPRYDQ